MPVFYEQCSDKLYLGLVLLHSTSLVSGLKIASALNTIDYTPELIASKQYYTGTTSLLNEGVANIVSDTSINLVANAETQALCQYAVSGASIFSQDSLNRGSLALALFQTHKDPGLIYIVAEVAHRLIANKKGITTLVGLKGKKIGSFPSTSAAYFVEELLASAGLKPTDYTVVSACAQLHREGQAHSRMLQHGTIVAIGMWEPTVQLTIDAIGESNLVIFRIKTVYREIFILQGNATNLKGTTTGKSFVASLKALIQVENIYNTNPSRILSQASAAVGVSVAVLKEVWPVHSFNGTVLAPDMLDFMIAEDAWVAQQDRRTAMTKADLTNLIDPSSLAEALAS